eukprot:g1137.t1
MSAENQGLTDLMALFACVWITVLGGVAFAPLHSTLVGEIVAGVAVGQIEAVDPLWIGIWGNVGLCCLVLEGGMSVDVVKIKRVGIKALLMAVTGTTLPLLSGWAILVALGKGSLESFAAGTCLSSTSIGIATKLLQSSNQLHTPLGNLISVTAITDDVLSLLILAILTNVSGDSTDLLSIAKPLLSSIGIACVGLFVAKLVPRLLVPCIERSEIIRRSSLDSGDALLISMLVLGIGLAAAAGYSGGTYLMGVFAAGCAFAPIDDIHAAWERHCATIARCLSSLFFVTIGMAIPLEEMTSNRGLLYGLILICPSILSKWVCGAFMMCGKVPEVSCRGHRFLSWNIVGWALVGRGELGLVIAQSARNSGLFDDEIFAIVVVAILVPTLLSPLVFSRYLKRRRVLITTEDVPVTGDPAESPALLLRTPTARAHDMPSTKDALPTTTSSTTSVDDSPGIEMESLCASSTRPMPLL